MKEIKKVDGDTTIIKVLDDNKNLIKLDIDSKDPDNTYHLIANYEYNDRNLLSRYYDNDGREVIFEYDEKDRIIWKRIKIGNYTDAFHYIYNEDTTEIIKVENMECDKNVTIAEFNHNKDNTDFVVNIECSDLNNLKDILEYCKSNDINCHSEYDYKILNRYRIKLDNEDQFNEVKSILGLDNVKGVD